MSQTIKILFFLVLGLIPALRTWGQCPTSSFASSSSVCQGEEVILSNTSLDGGLYAWDFCPGDLDSLGVASFVVQDDNFAFAFHLTLEQEGSLWYGFAPN
ncbi:MAG: hypothetical protein JXR03_06925, partial [Cyclobacteriaceae bacterium]